MVFNMKPYCTCKMKALNCALFSVVHVVCYISPGKYSTGNTALYTLQ